MSARRDALTGLVLAGIGLAAWLWLIPAFAGTGEQAIMPLLAAALTGGLAALLAVVSTLRFVRADRAPRGAEPRSDDDPFLELDGRGEPPRLLLVAAIWGVVLVFPQVVGLQLGSAAAVALTFLVLGIRRPLTILVWTVLPVAVLHVTFEYGFGLRLPSGAIVKLFAG